MSNSLLAGLFAGNFKKFAENSSPTSPTSPKAAKHGYVGYVGDDVLEKFLKNEQSAAAPIERPDMSVTADMSNTADMSTTLPLNLGRIADAIAANPRSPILGDLALAVFTRHAVEAQRTIEHLPAAAKVEAFRRCREVENEIVSAISSYNYETAYRIAGELARLPDELGRFALQ
jgi:hypothetical protein